MSPYQIAKKVDISRPSIYNALGHMVNKGMVELVPEDTVMYIAQDPEILINNSYIIRNKKVLKERRKLWKKY